MVPRSREPPGRPGGGPRARPSVRSARGTSSRSPPRTDRRRSRPGRRTRALRPGRRRRSLRAAPRPARSSAPTVPGGRHRARTWHRCRVSGSRAPPTGRCSPGRPRRDRRRRVSRVRSPRSLLRRIAPGRVLGIPFRTPTPSRPGCVVDGGLGPTLVHPQPPSTPACSRGRGGLSTRAPTPPAATNRPHSLARMPPVQTLYSASEVAEEAGCDEGRVHWLEQIELVWRPDERGRFTYGSVLAVKMVIALMEGGIAIEDDRARRGRGHARVPTAGRVPPLRAGSAVGPDVRRLPGRRRTEGRAAPRPCTRCSGCLNPTPSSPIRTDVA